MLPSLPFIALVVLAVVALAHAETTHIGGTAAIQTGPTTQTAVGIGAWVKADNMNASTGAGTTVGGRFTANAVVAGESAVALGAGAAAANYTASVAAGGTSGDANLTAATGQIATLALGPGARACTTIASVNRPTGAFSAFVATGDIINVGIGFWSGHVSIGSSSPC